ncbi:hypothetical protein GCM10027277_00240 [Pseudoduganella ginsengisoli]|uniref:ABC transporter substrate-binding protein n=1 Tax=Pseudoduganella ginsengisoli TaxID=1462440 RepID=A0A6L6Q2N8_9BURK|nr:hypothetical protein [Pseudoduganella ginsengisoli]MTW03910.1 hypothetical protein [Pseudoduganella ginsengisoli]
MRIVSTLLRHALLCCLLWWQNAMAGEPRVAVLYPDIGGAYRTVFASMIAGIDDRVHGKSIGVEVGPNTASLQAELKRQDVKVVIALGRQAIKAAAGLEQEFKVIGGGVLNVPDLEPPRIPVRTLAPDPALLLARLKALQPRVRRVHVVYDPVQNGWLIKLAQRAARAQGMELAAHDAADIKAAMQQYQAILAALDPQTEALWLPQDTVTVQDSVVLPLVLRSAWTGSLTVFSSSVGHVRQGVLFALFPDNAAYGRHLGALAQAMLGNASLPDAGLAPLRELSSAINLSTLNHLQLKPGGRALQEFDITFPEP